MAPTHFLVIPRKPIPTLSATQAGHNKVCVLILTIQLYMLCIQMGVGHLLRVAKELAEKLKLLDIELVARWNATYRNIETHLLPV